MFLTRTEYDRGVNTFSPEERLFQVEYAIEAIKLLDLLAEELLDKGPGLTPDPAVQRTLEPLLAVLGEAKDFLNFASEGSKIYLVLEKEAFMKRHQQVISQLVESLDVITYDELGIFDEVREQALKRN